MKENNDFWKDDPVREFKFLAEEAHEMIENENNSEEKRPLSDGEVERIGQRYERIEREFEATFSYAYDNCRETRYDSIKIILATTPTVDQGIEFVRTKLLMSYPNLDINSITHKED